MIVTLLLSIAALLFLAKLLGEVTERFGLSSLLGEIFAGIILGSLLHVINPSQTLEEISMLGIVVLMFILGTSVKLEDIKPNIYSASFLAIAGGLLSFIGGFIVGLLIFNSVMIAVFVGIVILSTSTPSTLRILAESGEFNTRHGKMIVTMDLADTVLAILAFAAFLTFVNFNSIIVNDLTKLFFAMIGFIILIITIGSKVSKKAEHHLNRLHDPDIFFSMALVFVFIIAAISEQIGLAAITGAFLAGMMLSNNRMTEPMILPKMKVLGFGFLIPLFFAYSAIVFEISALWSYSMIIIVLVVIGVAAKIVGCGYLAKHFGFKTREWLFMGVGMVPRGAVNIVIAQVALAQGVIDTSMYTIIISFTVITIILTPVLFKVIRHRYY